MKTQNELNKFKQWYSEVFNKPPLKILRGFWAVDNSTDILIDRLGRLKFSGNLFIPLTIGTFAIWDDGILLLQHKRPGSIFAGIIFLLICVLLVIISGKNIDNMFRFSWLILFIIFPLFISFITKKIDMTNRDDIMKVAENQNSVFIPISSVLRIEHHTSTFSNTIRIFYTDADKSEKQLILYADSDKGNKLSFEAKELKYFIDSIVKKGNN